MKNGAQFLFLEKNDEALSEIYLKSPKLEQSQLILFFCTIELRPELQCEITFFCKAPISLDLSIVSHSKGYWFT